METLSLEHPTGEKLREILSKGSDWKQVIHEMFADIANVKLRSTFYMQETERKNVLEGMEEKIDLKTELERVESRFCSHFVYLILSNTKSVVADDVVK